MNKILNYFIIFVILFFRLTQIRNTIVHLKVVVGQSNGMLQNVSIMEHLVMHLMYGVTVFFYGRCTQKENNHTME